MSFSLPHRIRPVLAGLALLVGGVTIGGVAVHAASKSPPAPKYNSLARTENVKAAPGRALGLSWVVIHPGAKIPLHFHEGTQVSYIQKGTLTYTVKTGAVTVKTGPGDSGQAVRHIKAGQTGKIKAGQWIVEQPSTVHRAANKGKGKVVIYLANLLKKNAAPSTLAP